MHIYVIRYVNVAHYLFFLKKMDGYYFNILKIILKNRLNKP